MSDVDLLNECISNGRCSAILYKLTGCPSCTDMKEKLDVIGLEYDEKEIDESSLELFQRSTVPFLHVSRNGEDDGNELVIENDTIERIKRNLGLLEILDEDD